MDSLSSIYSNKRNFDFSDKTFNSLLQQKREALSSLEIFELEENNFSRNNSEYLEDEDDNSNIIIVSSRTNCQFTERINEEIQKMSNIQIIIEN